MSNRIAPINERTERMAAIMQRGNAIEDELAITFSNADRTALLKERDQGQAAVLAIYKEAVQHYRVRGFETHNAEMSANFEYVRARDLANERYINTIPEHERILNWLDHATQKVMERLQRTLEDFKRTEPPEQSDAEAYKKYQSKLLRYPLIEKLIAREANPQKRGNEVERIVRGYLTEFVTQTEQQTHACNIANQRNEAEKAYWESRPPKEFEDARCRGMMHSAFSFSRLKSVSQTRADRKAAWEATGDIIGACIQTFKEEYPKYDPESQPMASVFNDHLKIIAQTYKLEDMFGTTSRSAF